MAKRDILADYPHLDMKRCWSLTETSAMNLGRCAAYIEALSLLPIPPEVQSRLRSVAFERGAQATTRIEGNTLTDEEFRQMLDGRELPKSRHYQAKEVQNAIDAMQHVWSSVIENGDSKLISPQMLCEWNRLIGKDLGPLYDGIPGKLRNDRRHVGSYLAPPSEEVQSLLEQLCGWLQKEFGFGKRAQRVEEAVIQAIVSHVFFEWIHPFADGNGRTGRLLEFYVLLRAGFPDITVHVLSNHYNQTRSEYTANFDIARKKRSLTEFLDYAIQGLTDGLKSTLATVQFESFKIAWESHVYRVFDSYTQYNKRSVFKRRRSLALAMPVEKAFTELELMRASDFLMTEYMGHDKRMLNNDISLLKELGLLIEEQGVFRANTQPMLARHFSSRAGGVMHHATDATA